MPTDKIAELEERFNKLEEKLRVTFSEIERRFGQLQQTPETNAEERIQELEDLLLLLQLESTKLKEKVGEGLDFGITPNVPDVSERLNSIESELSSRTTDINAVTPASSDVEAKIVALEERINSIPTTTIKVPKDVEKHVKDSMAGDMNLLEKRVRTLEALLAQRGRHELEHEESTLLSDIHNILKRG